MDPCGAADDLDTGACFQSDGAEPLSLPAGRYGCFPLTGALMSADGRIWACPDYREEALEEGQSLNVAFAYSEADPLAYDEEEALGIARNSQPDEDAAAEAVRAWRASCEEKLAGDEGDAGEPDGQGSADDAEAEVVEEGRGWAETVAGDELPFEPVPSSE